MKSYNGTIEHHGNPKEERPDYLSDLPYVLAVDTETTGNNWFDEHRPFLATASDYDQDYLYNLEDENDCRNLMATLWDADELVFHNASYDLHMLRQHLAWEPHPDQPIHDTHLLARLTIPMHDVPNYKLKTLAEIFIDPDAKESELAIRECMKSLGLIRNIEQQELPDGAFYEVWKAYPEILEKYALKDTRYTYDLFYFLKPKLTDRLHEVYDLELATLPVMLDMEKTGARLEPERVNALEAEYRTRQADQSAALLARTWPEFNYNSDPDVRLLVEQQGVELTEKTPTGQIAVNKWALQRAAGAHPEITDLIEAIFDARSTTKFLSTYISPMVGRETVHPDFRQIGARTGRLSCMRPNMQNIPVRSGPEMRSMYVPRPGNFLVVADFKSIELRLLDYYMNGGPLGEIIAHGDPFLWLGEQIFGTSDQSKWDIERGPLKNGFYAMTYGAGGPRFAETVGGGVTPEEGRAIIKKIKAVLGPKYASLNRGIRQKIGSLGYVTTLAGRKQYVPRDKSYVGLNALIQGSAADIMKLALVRSHEVLGPGKLILTVHDELVADTPDEGDLSKMLHAMKGAEDLAPNGKLILEVDGGAVRTNYSDVKG